MKWWFDVHQTAVCIEAPDEDSAAAITRYLQPFATAQTTDADYTISIEHGALDGPPGPAEHQPPHEIAPGLHGHLIMDGHITWCSVPKQFSALADLPNSKSTLKIAPGCTRAALGLAAVHTIDRMLEATGRQLLHGAALLLPNGSNQAMLIFGKSGMGKTTTCLALAQQGFALLTDDAIVLEAPSGCQKFVWGLPRPVKVHRRTGELLPFLQPVLSQNWDDAGEQPVQLEKLSTVVKIGDHAQYAVAGIVLLGERKENTHDIMRISKADAMLDILLDNLHSLPASARAKQSQRFSALGMLLAGVPTFRLRVCPNLSGLAQMTHSLWVDHAALRAD